MPFSVKDFDKGRYPDDDHWSEVGEFSADGETWSQFFGMELDGGVE